jgi:NACHT domain
LNSQDYGQIDRLSPGGLKISLFFLQSIHHVRDQQGQVKVVKVVNELSAMRETFLKRGSRHVVIGQPGAGKTTWVDWLQSQELTQSDSSLAVVIHLRELSAAKLPSLHQLVREAAGLHLMAEVESYHIRTWLNIGRIALLFDGFDEIAPNEREAFIEWLNALETAAGAGPVIITSRPLTSGHFGHLAEKFTKYWEIQAFDEPRVVDYIGRWYRYSPLLQDDQRLVDAPSLGRTWLGDPVIGPLTGNPLVLTTLLVVNHLDGKLPEGRSKLYERYVEGMLGLWDDKRKVRAATIDLTRSQKHRILTRIALHFQLCEIDLLDEGPMSELVEKLLQENHIEYMPVEVLALLRERTGLLIGPGMYSFVHKSVGEFLVAQAVIEGDQRDELGERVDRMRLFKERHSDRWLTVLFFWAGLTGLADLEDFIDRSLEVPGQADFELVYGLIYDQISRFPVDWAKKAVLRLFDRKDVFETGMCWGFSLAPELSVTHPPEPKCLSASGDELEELMNRLGFEWEDFSRIRGPFLPAIWVAVGANAKNVLAWQRALNVDPQTFGLPSYYYLFGLWEIGRVLDSADPELAEHLIDIYRKTFPDHSGIIPVYLLFDFVMQVERREKAVDRSFTTRLQVIRNQRAATVDEGWLKQTRDMRIYWSNIHDDLLSRFEKSLQEAIQRNFVHEDELAASAGEYVSELRARRDSLLEQSLNEERSDINFEDGE